MKRNSAYLVFGIVMATFGSLAWTLNAFAGYETAEYEVVESDGDFEIRQYPDLMLASTSSEGRGSDGRFMTLFRYISGENDAEKKIEMTTPVFMEKDGETSESMGFLVPKDVAEAGIPSPKSPKVTIRKREGGRFVVVRFSGRLNDDLATKKEKSLREWAKSKDLEVEDTAETAGYDPPFTPGPLRRNEILIRIKASTEEGNQPSAATNE